MVILICKISFVTFYHGHHSKAVTCLMIQVLERPVKILFDELLSKVAQVSLCRHKQYTVMQCCNKLSADGSVYKIYLKVLGFGNKNICLIVDKFEIQVIKVALYSQMNSQLAI